MGADGRDLLRWAGYVISVSQATDKDRKAWDDFVASADNAEAYQPYEWRNVFESVYGHRCFYLMAHVKNVPD